MNPSEPQPPRRWSCEQALQPASARLSAFTGLDSAPCGTLGAINPEARRTTHWHDAAACSRLTTGLARVTAELTGADAAPTDPDRLGLIVMLYHRSDEDPESRLAAFVTKRHDLLAAIFDAYADDSRAHTLLSPDALLVFDRLEHDPDRLKELWQACRPLDELEELASVFGVAV